MSIDIAIPADRLALLDTATLFHGSHVGRSGGPDCKHCARELLHEIVTGEHADRTPRECTALTAIFTGLNDAPYWRDDAHRTEVLRPYLRKCLPPRFGGLDPAHDRTRLYALVDHVYRTAIPEICDALKLHEHAAALRALTPIVDPQSAKAASGSVVRVDLVDLVDLGDLVDLVARADLGDLVDLVDFDALAALAARADLVARAARPALDRETYREDLAKTWEAGVKRTLDLICAIP